MKETVRLYLTEELKDSTRGTFRLSQIVIDLGINMEELKIELKALVLEKVLTVFELETGDEVFVELQI